jgi:hypothetical protein
MKKTGDEKSRDTVPLSELTLSGQSGATSLFSTVRFTLCDTYIDFPKSVNSGKLIF